MRLLGSGLTHLIFTAMQKRSAVEDSSLNAHACRSRRGEAPEGSPVFSPNVEGAAPKTSGKKSSGKIYDPARVSHLPGSQATGATPWRGRDHLRCPVHGSSGPRPSTSWLGNGHPQGVLRSPPFIMSWWTSVLLKCVTPVNPCPRFRKLS